jgi:hypothetical protein
MALDDIVFNQGETDGIINEIPTNSYSGTLSDVQSEGQTHEGALVNELNKPTVIVDNRRKVR